MASSAKKSSNVHQAPRQSPELSAEIIEFPRARGKAESAPVTDVAVDSPAVAAPAFGVRPTTAEVGHSKPKLRTIVAILILGVLAILALLWLAFASVEAEKTPQIVVVSEPTIAPTKVPTSDPETLISQEPLISPTPKVRPEPEPESVPAPKPKMQVTPKAQTATPKVEPKRSTTTPKVANTPSPFEVYDCDRLATRRYDTLALVAGVRLDNIQSGPAIAACRRAISQFPNEPRFRLWLANAYASAGAYPSARASLGPLLMTGTPGALGLYGTILEKEGDPRGAARYFRLGAQAGDPISMHNYGHTLDVGSGGMIDRQAAAYWIRKALSAGVADTRQKLNAGQGSPDLRNYLHRR